MAFKTLIRGSTRLIPAKTIRFMKSGHIRISKDLAKKCNKKFVKIMIDFDYKKFAIVPSDEITDGYVLQARNKNGCPQIQSSLLKKASIIGDMPARFTEGKIIIDCIDTDLIKYSDFNYREDE